MDPKRLLLYLATGLLGFSLTLAWLKDYPPQGPRPVQITQEQTTEGNKTDNYVPSSYTPGASPTKAQAASSTTSPQTQGPLPPERQIVVKTDVLDVLIDRLGGNLVSAKLPQYPVSLQEKDVPVQILTNDPTQVYVLQSGLTNQGDQGTAILFHSLQKEYALSMGQQLLNVVLQGETPQGLHITKTYTFRRDNYSVVLTYQVHNATEKPWAGSLYTQITRREPEEKGSFYMRSYNGAAISSPEKPYEKLTYKELAEKNVDRTIQGGWIAMQQQYFLTSWIPASRTQNYHYYSHRSILDSESSPLYTVGFVSPQMTIPPGNSAANHATLYVGPEIASQLATLAPGLDHTIDYGWLWWVSVIIFWVMNKIEWVVGNWGWSIVITTILIKLLFYWFTAKSFRSMAKIRELQPKMQALKERYVDDRQAMSKATMELYRKEKVNPLGGCLPMLIQLPVFIGLYYVLIESVQLRQAPFIWWIHDLSAKDPYYVLPVLMGISMAIQQWLTPTTVDPNQQKIMWIMPVLFTVFFLNFPSGLVVYWLVNNVVQILQQWYVTKTYEQHKAKMSARKKKKEK